MALSERDISLTEDVRLPVFNFPICFYFWLYLAENDSQEKNEAASLKESEDLLTSGNSLK